MTAADRARQRRWIQAMMAVMSGFVRRMTRSETPLRWLAMLGGSLAAAAGCSIDNRNVQDNSPNGASGSSGTSQGSGDGSFLGSAGSSSAADGSPTDLSRGPGGSEPAGSEPNGSSAFANDGNGGLPGAAGAGSGAAGASATSGACPAGTQRCADGTLQVCNEDGMWASLGMTCGECVPDASECSGSTLRVCSSTGVWIDRLQCAGSQPVCQAASGSCVCNESSCPLGQICSAETFTCVQEVSDCPVPRAIPISEDIDHGIISVRFDAATGSADVRIQNIGTGTVFFAAVLCNGPSDDDCVLLRDGVTIQLNARDTLDVTIPNMRVEGGELALLNNYPSEAILGFAYVAWGTGPASNQLETLANADDPNWRPGQRIQIAPGDTGFVSSGNSDEAAGYTSCNPARLTP